MNFRKVAVFSFIKILSLTVAFTIPTFAVPVKKIDKCFAKESSIRQAIGLGSGLFFVQSKSKKTANLPSIKERQFVAISDRGPNVDGPRFESNGKLIPSKVLVDPKYVPRAAFISCVDGEYEVKDELELKDELGRPLGGLPPEPKSTISKDPLEIVVDSNFNQIKNGGVLGVDPEGIAIDKHGNYWIVDEYGPSLLKFNSKGRLLKQYSPGEGLPKWLTSMQPNRGFEGIAITPDQKIVLAMQSARISKKGDPLPYIDILVFDESTQKSRHLKWALPVKDSKEYQDTKVGDIVAISNSEILAIRSFRSLVSIEQISLAASNESESIDSPKVESHTVLNLTSLGWKKDKTEGLAILPDNQTIVIMNDDDFSVKSKVKLNPSDLIIGEEGEGRFASKDLKLKIKEKKGVVGPELWFIELADKIS